MIYYSISGGGRSSERKVQDQKVRISSKQILIYSLDYAVNGRKVNCLDSPICSKTRSGSTR